MLLPLSQSSLATFSLRRKETRLGEKFQMRKLELGFGLLNHSRPKTKQASCWFFQHFWLDVWTSICSEIKQVFTIGAILECLYETLITLILKFQSPKTLSNYGPISLCNLAYKIVSKIVVGWIKPMPNNRISPTQAAFVLGRKGIDNVFIFSRDNS